MNFIELVVKENINNFLILGNQPHVLLTIRNGGNAVRNAPTASSNFLF